LSTDVNKIIDNALGQVRSILVEAVEQVNEDTRVELIEKFNQAVGTGAIISVKAPRVSAKTSPKAKTAKKNKPKRVVSEATRKKLSANLKKARDAKAAKAKAPAKKTKTKAKTKKK
jgi:hypothetical protein